MKIHLKFEAEANDQVSKSTSAGKRKDVAPAPAKAAGKSVFKIFPAANFGGGSTKIFNRTFATFNAVLTTRISSMEQRFMGTIKQIDPSGEQTVVAKWNKKENFWEPTKAAPPYGK